MGILVPIVAFVVIAYVIKVVSDNKVRKMAIQKGELDENIKYLVGNYYGYNAPASLKWGMVLLAVGLGIFVGQVIDAIGFGSDEFTFAMMFIFGGVAMIAYYFIASKMVAKAQER